MACIEMTPGFRWREGLPAVVRLAAASSVRAAAGGTADFPPATASAERPGAGPRPSRAGALAFQDVPRAARYAATEAYVESLAEGLGRELRSRGVEVLAVAPGPVASDFADRVDMHIEKAQTPTEVATGALRALGRRQTVRPGFLAKFLEHSLTLRLTPLRAGASTRLGHEPHDPASAAACLFIKGNPCARRLPGILGSPFCRSAFALAAPPSRTPQMGLCAPFECRWASSGIYAACSAAGSLVRQADSRKRTPMRPKFACRSRDARLAANFATSRQRFIPLQ